MSMRKVQRIFVILCTFIMLLSVNNSVNAIDTTTPAPTTTTAAGTITPTTPVNPNEKIEILFKSRWTGNDRLSARVHLFANGEELDIQTTNPSTGQQRDGIVLDYQNAWEYRQANLPRYDQDGNEITYTATQEIINEDLFAFRVSKNFGGLNFGGPLWGTVNFKKFKG